MCDDRKSFCMIIIPYTNVAQGLERTSRTSQRRNFIAGRMRGFHCACAKIHLFDSYDHGTNNFRPLLYTSAPLTFSLVPLLPPPPV
jgi:hypothetical protein